MIRKQQTDDPLGSPRVGESCHKVTERGRSVLPSLCEGRWHLAAEVRRLVSIRAPHPRVGSDPLIAQTVDKPMRQRLDTHGGIVKGGGYAPLHVQSAQKWELFRKFPFWRFKLSTLCRQLERSPDRSVFSPCTGEPIANGTTPQSVPLRETASDSSPCTGEPIWKENPSVCRLA